jgi:hypothetical protein
LTRTAERHHDVATTRLNRAEQQKLELPRVNHRRRMLPSGGRRRDQLADD